MAFNYYSLIENDLLSFIYSMTDACSKSKLLRCASKFYSDEDIIEAHRILFSSISFEALNQYKTNYKSAHPLVAIYNCIHFIQKDILPMIVYKSLDNIPPFAHRFVKVLSDKTIFIKEEDDQNVSDFDESSDEEDDPQLKHYKKELELMKFEFTDIASVVLQVKDQIDLIKSSQSGSPKADDDEPKSQVSHSSGYSSKGAAHIKTETLEITEGNGKSSTPEKQLEEENAGEVIVVVSRPNDWEGDSSQCKNEIAAKPTEKVIYIKDEPDISHSASPMNLRDVLKRIPKSEIDTHCAEDDDTLIVDMSRPNQCDVCSKSFSTQLELDSHMQVHPSRTEFNCILCDKIFRSRKDLRNHFLLCYKDNEERLLLDGLICTTCGRMYGDPGALQKHKNVHSLARSHACSQCTYRFLTKKALDTHTKTLHNKLNKYFCPFCDHSYICNNYLSVHIRSHTGEKPFKCDQCDYRAGTKCQLAKHALRHEVQEEHSCDLCDYVCRGVENLRSHKSKAHRTDVIKCTVCRKQFKNPSSYNTHFLTHSGEKAFKCSICPYAGLTKATLTSHMKIHTGSELMLCPHCSMPFRTNFSYKRHLRTHAKVEKF